MKFDLIKNKFDLNEAVLNIVMLTEYSDDSLLTRTIFIMFIIHRC